YAVAAAYAPCSAICSFINYVKQKRGGWWRFFGMNYAKNINDSAAPALMERTNRLILFGGTPLKR
ncbi:MAG TPA: hypothetical protein PKW60_12880, partial [Candidatus Hydrogenedentes bacterium]|nr:hypothetical protein [Candidatus Hydrogenedentota bacterium]